jgi:hypothetical protein
MDSVEVMYGYHHVLWLKYSVDNSEVWGEEAIPKIVGRT